MAVSVGHTSATPDPDHPRSIGGGIRFVPGQNHDQVTVVNGKIELRQRLRDLWTNRELLVLLTRSELKVKYKNSVLGYAWSMLNPAMVLGIYYVIFKVISRNPQPDFAIWLFAGLLAWNLFNNSAMSSTGVVVGKAGIVKKVAFPRELLALSVAGVAFILFLIQVVVLIIFLFGFQLSPDFAYVPLLPLALLDLLIFTAAVSIFLSAVNVYLRDTQHLTEILLMAWFWATPIVYTYGLISARASWVKYFYLANPMTDISLVFQRAIYGKDRYLNTSVTPHVVEHILPGWSPWGYAALMGWVLVVSIACFLGALVVFGRLEGNFAEEL